MKFEDFVAVCSCNATRLVPHEHDGECDALRLFYRFESAEAAIRADERQKLLEGAVRVYGTQFVERGDKYWCMDECPGKLDTHQALLIQVEKLEGK